MGNHDLDYSKGVGGREKSLLSAFPSMQFTPGAPGSAAQKIPINFFFNTKKGKDLSYLFTYHHVLFVGLDEYSSGSSSKPSVSSRGAHGIQSSP